MTRPGAALARYDLGECHARLGRRDDAVAAFARAASLVRTDPLPRRRLAEEQARRGAP